MIKYCYAVDINNLPINESTTDQKRKIKKKNVYALNTSSTSNGSSTTTGPTATTVINNNGIITTTSSASVTTIKSGAAANTPPSHQAALNRQQQGLNQPNSNVMSMSMVTKPRSRTEIHPGGGHGFMGAVAHTGTINATTLSAAAAAAAAAVASSSSANSGQASGVVASSGIGSAVNSPMSPSRTHGSISNAVDKQVSSVATPSSTQQQQQVMLNRQRKLVWVLSLFMVILFEKKINSGQV